MAIHPARKGRDQDSQWDGVEHGPSLTVSAFASPRFRLRPNFQIVRERHFRHALTEFVEHYHRERNHQGLNNRLIAGTPTIEITSRVRRCPRLGGLLNFYERAA